MSNNHLTDRELIHYLSLTSSDPLILRLVGMLHSTRGGIVSDLEEAGMDPKTWTFTDDHQDYYPGEYVTHLQKMADYAEEELASLQYRFDDLQEELDRLKTRSVVEFIQEVEKDRQTAIDERRFAIAQSQRLSKENDELREKINVWKILESE